MDAPVSQYSPNDATYGAVYMEKARGRILFAISEMNTTRKGLNAVSNIFSTNTSTTGDEANTLRGAAYREAMTQILKEDDKTLGDYSTVSNALDITKKSFGGKRKRKNVKKTQRRK
jgi:hypothetical protein